MIGKNAFDFLPEDVAKSRKAKLTEVARTGKMANFEIFNELKPSLMWHMMAKQNNQLSASGIVTHYFGNNVWTTACYGQVPSQTVTLDGLFIAVDAKKCLERDVWFDEDFDFHFYDLSFSLRAVEKGLKIGTYPIFVVHHGLGDISDIDAFLRLQEKFYDKYCPRD
jgi:hypothetical protein